MSNGINRSSVRVTLSDVHGRVLRDAVNLKFFNVRLASERSEANVTFRGRPVRIGGLPAVPNGFAQVFITPTKYRAKSIFLNVPADGSGQINEIFFVEPGRVKPQFPSFTKIQTQQRWSGLKRLLVDSGLGTSKKWTGIDDPSKAGLLNLFCKMNATLLGGSAVVDLVRKVEKFLPARIFARVDPNLIDLVGNATHTFHTVPGALHSFEPPWKAVEPENSWKTFDRAGNLQLTFATDGRGNFLADIDIDDHQGIEHAADVLKHVFTGKDTHPYDIHQILIFFQHLDPGYSLA